MITSERVSFHEATVIRFCRHNAALEIELEDVWVDGNKSRVLVTVSPVFDVTIDGELSDKPFMELGDGEVLSLDVSSNGIAAVIEWNDFSQRKSVTKAYKISGGSVAIIEIGAKGEKSGHNTINFPN